MAEYHENIGSDVLFVNRGLQKFALFPFWSTLKQRCRS
jgi:hypothetical protein